MQEARWLVVQGGTEQRHRERVGTLQVTHKELVVLLGPQEWPGTAATGSTWLGLLSNHFLRWQRECLTQDMEIRHL